MRSLDKEGTTADRSAVRMDLLTAHYTSLQPTSITPDNTRSRNRACKTSISSPTLLITYTHRSEATLQASRAFRSTRTLKMTGERKTATLRGQFSRMPFNSTTESIRSNDEAPNQNARNASTAKPSRLAFLDLPAELRNKIYRYNMISNEPIKVQSARTWHDRHRFTILPALTFVSKQVRLETQRIFLEENEFIFVAETLRQRNMPALFAFRSMHWNVGLEIQTLHVCLEIEKRSLGVLWRLLAYVTLSKAGDRITIVNQAYSNSWMHETLGRVQDLGLGVCDCGVRRFVKRSVMRESPMTTISFRSVQSHRA